MTEQKTLHIEYTSSSIPNGPRTMSHHVTFYKARREKPESWQGVKSIAISVSPEVFEKTSTFIIVPKFNSVDGTKFLVNLWDIAAAAASLESAHKIADAIEEGSFMMDEMYPWDAYDNCLQSISIYHLPIVPVSKFPRDIHF